MALPRHKRADVKDRGLPILSIYRKIIKQSHEEVTAWFNEQGFRWTECRVGREDWVVFDRPEQAFAFKMRWL